MSNSKKITLIENNSFPQISDVDLASIHRSHSGRLLVIYNSDEGRQVFVEFSMVYFMCYHHDEPLSVQPRFLKDVSYGKCRFYEVKNSELYFDLVESFEKKAQFYDDSRLSVKENGQLKHVMFAFMEFLFEIAYLHDEKYDWVPRITVVEKSQFQATFEEKMKSYS